MRSPGLRFGFECRGCANMKLLEMGMDMLRRLALVLVGREDVG